MTSTWQLVVMARQYGLSGLVASINPKAWDAIVPHTAKGLTAAAGSLRLSPEPEAPSAQVLLGFDQFCRVALAGIGSRDGMSTFAVDIDDWCGTGWPKRWPWPWPGPDPDPEPTWRTAGVFLGASLAAAELAAHYPKGEFRDTLEAAGEKLAAQVPAPRG